VNILPFSDQRQELIRSLTFVARCALAAAASYKLAWWIGLSMPVWAAMSALIVSQDRWQDTELSLQQRIRGTLLGVSISLAVNLIAMLLGASTTMQLIVAVAICAAIARADRSVRVCMWTCPIVLIPGLAGTGPVIVIGLYRAIEIVVGCLVAAAFHLLAERLLAPMQIVRE
jgi:uncharacterized membrane protein YccC